MIKLENEWISIGFNSKTGSLESLFSKAAQCEFISPGSFRNGNPFGIWDSFFAPYRFVFDENSYKNIFYSSKVLPPDPRTIANTCIGPTDGVKFEHNGNAMALSWRTDDLDIHITVSLDGHASRWEMTIVNSGSSTRSILPVFPWINGIQLSGKTGRMVALNQAGYIADIWAHEGGAYGNCFHHSGQFGCLFEEDTGNALGFYLEDESFGAKDIRYVEPSVQVRWFPDKKLDAGESVTLPTTVIMPYRGSWKQTAVAYGDWFRRTARPDPTPEWILNNHSYIGAWAEKKGDPYGDLALRTAMDSLDELAVGHIMNTADTIEYAFYCAGSMRKVEPEDRISEAMSRRHTDGWNTIRPDLGGMEALKKGVDRVHENGKRVTLYVEGLIVPEESELFDHIPEAKEWLVMNADGGNFGPYTGQKFFHMCAGCSEWQEHLAGMIARLVKESGVDGVRIDSLNFYFWPCYNPAHNHASPFDYNAWVQALYSKVAAAVKKINPDILLAVEGPSDYVNLHFNLALHQMVGDQNEFVARDTAPLRVALPDFVVVQWNGGGVAQSLRLLPDGTGHAGESEVAGLTNAWFTVRHAAAASLSTGNAATPNPVSSSPDMHCRWIQTPHEDIIIGARPEDAHGMLDPVLLKKDTIRSTVTVPLGYLPTEFFLYDIEKLTISPLAYNQDRRGISFFTTSNWFMAIAYKNGGDKPMLLIGDDRVKRGEILELSVYAPTVEHPLEVRVEPVGLTGGVGGCGNTNETVAVSIPEDTRPGYYWINAEGGGLRSTVKTILVLE